jgi:hypothetical protein
LAAAVTVEATNIPSSPAIAARNDTSETTAPVARRNALNIGDPKPIRAGNQITLARRIGSIALQGYQCSIGERERRRPGLPSCDRALRLQIVTSRPVRSTILRPLRCEFDVRTKGPQAGRRYTDNAAYGRRSRGNSQTK